MTEKIREKIIDLLYEENWYLFNRWGDPDSEFRAKQINVDILELITEGAYKAPEGFGKEPIVKDPPKIESPHLLADYQVPEWQVKGNDFPIVGRRFTPEEFAFYLQHPGESWKWNPSGITAHHTAYPDLKMRPNGFEEQHMLNLRSYYKRMGWWSGPHIFTDDNGIWVLTPVTRRGVHARSFNSSRIGVEMLGNFDSKTEYESERGEKSMQFGKIAIALMMNYLGIDSGKLNFHRNDPSTSKTCPGKLIEFDRFENEVIQILESM